VRFDSVRINVSDLNAGTRAYELLLGVGGAVCDGTRRFQLERGAVELVQGEPGLNSLCFAGNQGEVEMWSGAPDAFCGLRVRIQPAFDATGQTAAGDAVRAIDHVVIHSPCLDRARALWRDRLGLRLALDRDFPERGLRMLFFRSGGVTLEFVGTVSAPADRDGPDRLWGLAYWVADLRACRARLLRGGIDVSDIRGGHKPGTQVATVRSGAAGIPTLLIGALNS
jgi:catechol 2,3-dioxygenase-like lactoylglutathione lyase family enzyme